MSAFAQDEQAAIRLQLFVHMEAARILRDNASKADGDKQHKQAKSLLDQHPYLQEPHHYLALIQFHEYRGSDSEVFNQWKKITLDQRAVGGAAGMYVMYAIRRGEDEFRQALRKLRQIYEGELGSADLNCQLGIMEFFAGNRDEAEEQYLAATNAKTPLIRLHGQWIALLLGDRDSVDKCCRDFEGQTDRVSQWERIMLGAFSGKLRNDTDVLRMAGTDRRLAVQGLISLALVRLSEADSENRDVKKREGRKLLEETTDLHLDYFGRYLAEAILDEWDHNSSEWPTRMATKNVHTQKVGD